jgi:hydroxymethylpyrimidine pyrophosphatase-like HAD family hydrolase
MYRSGSGSDRFYLEIRNAHTNKATGLASVLKHLGVQPRQCASIGDYTNDLEMCKFTGVSAAMRNGCDELKAVTDVVTLRTNDEDGVAEFLRLILAQHEGSSA